jgi:cysteine-rich repeat protein
VINVGDINDDGTTDIVMSGSRDDSYSGDQGSHYLLLMKPDGDVLSYHLLHRQVEGLQNGHGYFKDSLIPRGDVDGDGVPDYGSYHNSVFLNADGSAKLAVSQSLSDGGYNWDHTYQGALLGDLDGDGVPEIARAKNTNVRISYQRRDGSYKDTQSLPNMSGSGRAVTSLGDLDGDGTIELAVGTNHGGHNKLWIHSLGTGCYTCGNGTEEPGEECDDNNAVSGDGCSATCKDERNWAIENPHVKYPQQGSKEMYLEKTASYGDKRYTIETWFKPTAGKDIDCLVCGGTTWKISLVGDNIHFKYRCGSGGDYSVLDFDTAITEQWHHVAIVGRWQGDRQHTLWVDGVDMGTKNLSCNLYTNSEYYGFEMGPGEFTADEAMLTWGARYQKPFEPLLPLRRPANVHLWWGFEEGAGGIAGDGANNGWMGEIFEGTWVPIAP